MKHIAFLMLSLLLTSPLALQAQSSWLKPPTSYGEIQDRVRETMPDAVTIQEPGSDNSVTIYWVCPAAAELHLEYDLTLRASQLQRLLNDVLGVQSYCVDAIAAEVPGGWDIEATGNVVCQQATVNFECAFNPDKNTFQCEIDGTPVPITDHSSADWNVYLSEQGWNCDFSLGRTAICTPTFNITLEANGGACGDWSNPNCEAYYYNAGLGWQLFPCAAEDPTSCGYSGATCARIAYFLNAPRLPIVTCEASVGAISDGQNESTQACISAVIKR